MASSRSTLFSIFLSLSVIQFSYLYGSRDVYDSINWTASQQHHVEKIKYPYKWSRKNNFISPQLFVLYVSGICTSDSHKYTKNVCMTGHNIKYHQNKRNKMEELEGFFAPHPTPPSLCVRSSSYFPHWTRPRPASWKYLEKNFMLEKENCGIKTCSDDDNVCGVKCHINGVAFTWIRCKFSDMASYSGLVEIRARDIVTCEAKFKFQNASIEPWTSYCNMFDSGKSLIAFPFEDLKLRANANIIQSIHPKRSPSFIAPIKFIGLISFVFHLLPFHESRQKFL